MDVSERIEASLPDSIEHLEKDGPIAIAELWLLARAYSRLRHRSSPVRHPERRRRCEALKVYCVRLAVARDPDAFLVFADPNSPHLLIIYHRTERTLLHVPLANWRDGIEIRGRIGPESNGSPWKSELGRLEALGA